MAAEKRAEHQPVYQHVLIDAIKYVGSVHHQATVNPYSQHPVVLADMVNDDFFFQALPLSGHKGPSSWAHALAVLPSFVGNVKINFPSAARAPHRRV